MAEDARPSAGDEGQTDPVGPAEVRSPSAAAGMPAQGDPPRLFMGTVEGAAEPDISKLVPTPGEHPAQVTRQQSIVLTRIPDAEPLDRLDGPVDIGDDAPDFYTRPAEGVIVTTEQRWHARAVTLGRLLHTLTLAPGESTRVAIVDWTRGDTGTATGDAGAQDRLTQALENRRDLSELAEASTRQREEGSSEATSTASSTSAGVNASFASLFGGFGATASTSANESASRSVARSSGERDAALSTAQNVAARTQQLATSARSQTASMVKETSQREAENVSTRVITNYNHMHAMSVCYYEVVQVYEVTTTTVRVDPCVFIPMAKLDFTGDAGLRLLRRYRSTLVAAALSREWAQRISDFDPFAVRVDRTKPSQPSDDTGLVSRSAAGATLEDLAAGSDGTVWGVNRKGGTPVRWDHHLGRWEKVEPLARVAVGGVNEVWAAAASQKLYRYDPGSGAFAQCGGEGSEISCAGDGVPWTIGHEGRAYRRTDTGDSWIDLGGVCAAISVESRTRAWVLGRDLNVYAWSEGNGQFEDDPAKNGVKSIAVAGDGSLWGIDTGANVVEWDGSAWQPRAPGAHKVAPVSSSEYWYLKTDGDAVHVTASTLTPRDWAEHPEGELESLTAWWDATGIRAMELVLKGATRAPMTIGEPAKDLSKGTYDVAAEGGLAAVAFHSSLEDGGGLRHIALTGARGRQHLGPEAQDHDDVELLDLDGKTVCGLFGQEARMGHRSFVASVGFYVRGQATADDVVRHLDANREHYSRAVWAAADELSLSRMFANRCYVPTFLSGEAREAEARVPLGVRVDPQPLATTGNYLAFRWNFPHERARRKWLQDTKVEEGLQSTPAAEVALPSGGVFAEAVLGRSNSAEKLDLTRFWDWQDSPIPILPPDISPVGVGSRARDMDVSPSQFGPVAAQLAEIAALPDPTGMTDSVKALTADIFDEMSNALENARLAQAALSTAGEGERTASGNALEGAKAAMSHFQEMASLALEAAGKLVPLVAPQAGLAGALGRVAAGGGASGALGGLLGPGATGALRPGAAGAAGGGARGGVAAALGGLVDGGAGHRANGGHVGGLAGAATSALTGGGLANASNSRVGAVINKAQEVDSRSIDAIADTARRNLLAPAMAELRSEIPSIARRLDMQEVDLAFEVDRLPARTVAQLAAAEATKPS